mmetsp:Transcript_11179/g.15592  ORF Transcript_11179/g.15592 Transcript_11179/m.15592 type:complete len:304 (+) Transcript_11179:320-1231(+)
MGSLLTLLVRVRLRYRFVVRIKADILLSCCDFIKNARNGTEVLGSIFVTTFEHSLKYVLVRREHHPPQRQRDSWLNLRSEGSYSTGLHYLVSLVESTPRYKEGWPKKTIVIVTSPCLVGKHSSQKRNVARGPEHIERVIARLKFTYSFAFEKWWFCLHSGDQDRQSSAQIFLHAGSSEYLHRFLCLGEHLPRVVFAFRLAAHYMSRYLLDINSSCESSPDKCSSTGTAKSGLVRVETWKYMFLQIFCNSEMIDVKPPAGVEREDKSFSSPGSTFQSLQPFLYLLMMEVREQHHQSAHYCKLCY